MKNLLLPAVLAVTVCSCTGELKWPDEPDEPKVSTRFSFDRIEYANGKVEAMEGTLTQGPAVTLSNNTSVVRTSVFELQKNAYDRVTFSRDYGQEFEFTDEDRKVKVPTFIFPDGFLECDGGTRWLYKEGDQELRPETNATETWQIPPGHALTITTSIRYRSITADYKLYLKGDEYGEERIVEGSFAGRFVMGYDTDSVMNELPNGD